MDPHFNIDQLRIATPCPAKWEQMSGNDSVRFCDVCQLNVYNIAGLTRSETESLIASAEGRLCARLYRRTDGTVLTKDCPVGLRALRMRISKRAAAVFAMLVGLAGAGFGQQSNAKDDKTVCTEQVKITRTDSTAAQEEKTLSGNVVDQSGGAIPGAIVTVTNKVTEEVRTTTTDDAGRFEFASLPPGDYSFKIEAFGFQTIQLANVSVEANKVINLNAVVVGMSTEPLTGIIAMPISVRPTTPGTTIITGDMLQRLPIQH